MSASDPLGRSCGYEYDELGRLKRITRPDFTAENIAYDANGNLTGQSYSDGTSFTYGYDVANRMTSSTGYSFTYDPVGRMTASNGFSYTHDLEGRLMSETLSPGKTVNYTYDPRGLPSGVTDWLTGSTSFTYDAAHRFTGMTRANGTIGEYSYDPANRLISSVEKTPGPSQISSIVITRDALGRTASIDRRQPLMPGQTMPASTPFSYDIASQMNGVSHDALGRTTVDGTRSFGWNGHGYITTAASNADSLNYTDDPFKHPKTIAPPHGGSAIQLAWGYGRGYPTNDDMAVSLPSRYRLHVRAPSGHVALRRGRSERRAELLSLRRAGEHRVPHERRRRGHDRIRVRTVRRRLRAGPDDGQPVHVRRGARHAGAHLEWNLDRALAQRWRRLRRAHDADDFGAHDGIGPGTASQATGAQWDRRSEPSSVTRI